jgi:peptide/nickel transport system ATP-binding protein
MTEPLLEVTELEKHFEQSSGFFDQLISRDEAKVQAVDGVSLTLDSNDTRGVIGESGCGKTTLLKTLIGLHLPTGGRIEYKGTDVADFAKADWKQFRKEVSIIFQDPFNSLNPRMTVREILSEPMEIHGLESNGRIEEVLEDVELRPVEKYIDKTPDALSGGENQRVSIARALIAEPELILADEPVSMLDVSTQAAILNLLGELSAEYDLSLIYISHDLSTVSYVCDNVSVMYLGRIVETAPTRRLIDEPKHPYTEMLLDAIPVPDPYHDRPRTVLEKAPDTPINLGEGCRFRDRCPERMDICEKTPRTVATGDGREAACHLHYDHEELIKENRINVINND